jgi:hypothetical protein
MPTLVSASTSLRSQRAQIIRHIAELPDHRGVAEITGGGIAGAAKGDGAVPVAICNNDLTYHPVTNKFRIEAPMSFEHDEFFSPDIDQFRDQIRSTAPFNTWFDYALDLNRMGLNLLKSASTPCWQLKQDMDSYSERRCPDKPIQIDFNFNIDLEELGQLNDVG